MPLTQVFVSISDPRSTRHTRHDLAELLTVAVCAVLSGVDDFVDIELWAEAKLDWLRRFMKLEHGIPSHDTIGRVFGMIAPDEFESAFRHWVGMVVPALAEDTVVAIDGKTSRRTGSKTKADAARCTWSARSPAAWALSWARRPRPKSPMRSLQFPNCSPSWRSRAAW